MNWLQKLILGKQLSSTLEQKAESLGRFEISGGRLVMPVDNKNSYICHGYNPNDIIFSVINMILDKVELPYWELYKVVDEKGLRLAHSILTKKNFTGQEYKKALKLKQQSLEPITSFNLQLGKLQELLKYPNDNDNETFQQFFRYGSLYKLLTGDRYVYGNVLGAGANRGIPNALTVMPSDHMTIDVTNDFPSRAAGYELVMWNQKFRPEQILHEIYPNPNWNINGEQLYGFSPLRSFLKNTVRNNAAKEASIGKYQNGGVEELLYFDDQNPDWTTDLKKKQAEEVKAKLTTREYKGPQAQGKIAVSAVKMGSVKLGNTPVELGIIDSEKWDAIMFCNGYGVPPELLGLTAKTFNNMKEAEKALTSRSAIPLLNAFRNAFNRKLITDWGFKGVNVYADYETECFPELQADQSETATWLDKVIMITPDEQREFLNMDSLNTTESREIWVRTATGYVPLSDFQASQVDQILNSMDQEANGGNQDNNRTNLRAVGNG